MDLVMAKSGSRDGMATLYVVAAVSFQPLGPMNPATNALRIFLFRSWFIHIIRGLGLMLGLTSPASKKQTH